MESSPTSVGAPLFAPKRSSLDPVNVGMTRPFDSAADPGGDAGGDDPIALLVLPESATRRPGKHAGGLLDRGGALDAIRQPLGERHLRFVARRVSPEVGWRRGVGGGRTLDHRAQRRCGVAAGIGGLGLSGEKEEK